MFKALVGAGHPEFSTMRQQDALEFFQHILALVQKRERARLSSGGFDPSLCFLFQLEDKITCNTSHRSRVTTRTDNILSLPIPLDKMTNPGELLVVLSLN